MKQLVNRVAKKEYTLTDILACGVVLTGQEIKAIRAGRANLTGSYATIMAKDKVSDPELWLIGGHIEGSTATRLKLLITKKQRETLIGASQQKHRTLVIVRGFFKDGYFKVEVALGQKLKKHEKRHKLREEDMRRQAARAIG